jgi:drug/metabolite transporter (DMT)-like permease
MRLPCTQIGDIDTGDKIAESDLFGRLRLKLLPWPSDQAAASESKNTFFTTNAGRKRCGLNMTVIALGLATAVAYGASDFLGGLASRRSQASLAVVALLKVTTLAVFMAAMPQASAAVPNVAAMTWGGLAGLTLALGYIAYFRGLAVGRMGIVSTVTAVWSAIVPLAAGLALGERPSPLTWTGIGVIVLAIVLITYTRARSVQAVPALSTPVVQVGPQCLIHCAGAAPPADQPLPQTAGPTVFARSRPILPQGVFEATLAGILFATFFVALDRAGAATGGHALAWPLLASAVSAAILVCTVAVIRRVQWRAALRQAPVIVAAGVLYAAGSWAFILAVSRGWISIIAVIVALSPAPTMLLARLLLAESLSARQLMGVLLALVGILLVTAGL